jgi:hypothetical protein
MHDTCTLFGTLNSDFTWQLAANSLLTMCRAACGYGTTPCSLSVSEFSISISDSVESKVKALYSVAYYAATDRPVVESYADITQRQVVLLIVG